MNSLHDFEFSVQSIEPAAEDFEWSLNPVPRPEAEAEREAMRAELVEAIRTEARRHEDLPGAASKIISVLLHDAAIECRSLQALDDEQYFERREVERDESRAKDYDRGFTDGQKRWAI